MPRRKKKKRLPKKGELHRYAPGGHAGSGKPVVALCVVAEGIHDDEFDKLRCALLRCLLSEDTVALPEGVRVSLLTPHEAREAGVRVPNHLSWQKQRINREPRKAWPDDNDERRDDESEDCGRRAPTPDGVSEVRSGGPAVECPQT